MSEEELKRQYKKLALRLHPDKNHSPQATEAFKKVTQAFSCLIKEEKRKLYDEHGNEEGFRTRYKDYFKDEDELDPEDLFDLLFNGRINRDRRRGRHGAQPIPQQGKWMLLVQALPLVLMFVLSSYMNYNSPSEPGFSLVVNGPYTYKRTTMTSGVPYYVEPTMDKNLLDYYDRPEFEQKVIGLYRTELEEGCKSARNEKFDLENSKNKAASQEEINEIDDKIESLDFTPCKKLNELSNSY